MTKQEGVAEAGGTVEDEAIIEATERARQAEAELARLKQEKRASAGGSEPEGLEELRKDPMMAHLLDSLGAGKDIGHYGRLVFAMVARHFIAEEEVLGFLMKDRDFSEEDALLMLRQVEGKDYSPPKRERILAWQAEQEFPILPHPEDPDCGNLYRTLKFPAHVYRHIGQYQEAKAQAGE